MNKKELILAASLSLSMGAVNWLGVDLGAHPVITGFMTSFTICWLFISTYNSRINRGDRP